MYNLFLNFLFIEKAFSFAENYVTQKGHHLASKEEYDDYIGEQLKDTNVLDNFLNFYWTIYEEYNRSYIKPEVFLFALKKFFLVEIRNELC